MRTGSFQIIAALTFVLGILALASAQELDITFNHTGLVTTDFTAGTDQGYGMVIQPDNKIVVAGATNFPDHPRNFALVRYNTDGSLDNSFGTGGKVITDVDANATEQEASAIALQPDGKMIVGGDADTPNLGAGSFVLVRYNTDGSLDTTFGAGGKVTTPVGQSAHYLKAIVIAPDGKIITAGWFRHTALNNWQTALVRYNSDGSLDTSFGTGGVVITLLGGGANDYNVTNSIALQPDGKIVTGGSYLPFGSFMAFDMTVRRYNTDGSLDASFAGGGQLVISSLNSEGINAVNVLPDGRILAAGSSGTSSMRDIVLLRLNQDGSSDASFGQNGRAVTSLSTMSGGSAMAVHPNGKITVAGLSRGSVSGAASVAVVAYNADGSVDTSFSDDGKLMMGFGNGGENAASAIGLDSLGRIVVAGYSNDMFGAARLYTRDPLPVSVSGQTLLSDGRPVKLVSVGLTDRHGQTRWTLSNPFGYYQFDGVPAGQTITVSVSTKRYNFEPKVIGLNESLTGVDLISVSSGHRSTEGKVDLRAVTNK